MSRSLVSTCILVLVFAVNTLFAQTENTLLDRSFWKTNPSLEIVKEKINAGNDPVAFDRNQFDATTLAITSKSETDVILYLLSLEGNDANKITHDGRTYMFWASLHGNLKVMDKLVKSGTNLKHIDEKGASITVFIASNGQKDKAVYDYLIEHGVVLKNELDKHGANILLLLSPFMNSFNETSYFTQKGIKLNDTDENGYGIFAYATSGGNKDFLNELIKAGIDPKVVAKDGGNAFLFATQASRYHSNALPFYQYLEELGIDPNTSTKEGQNPLHQLYRTNNAEIVDYFISKGVDVNQQNKLGTTPLMLASGFQKDKDVFLKFFEKGNKLNQANKDGQTALTYAISYNNAKIAAMLIAQGADITIVDKDGNDLGYYIAKHYRSNEDYHEKLKLLNTFGLCNCKLQTKGNTLYHIAVESNNQELLKELANLQVKYDINKLNEDGLSPLHIAALQDSNGEMIKLLIELGASKEVETTFGETAYMLAIENELLIQNNIDLNFLK